MWSDEDRKVHGRTGLARGRQRRIERPATADAVGACRTFDEHRDAASSMKAGDEQPERDVVHARERHIRRADHDRHHPVGKAADQRRHDHEEDHDQGVGRREDVVHVLAAVDGSITVRSRRPSGPDRWKIWMPGSCSSMRMATDSAAADDARHDREDQVESADVLVVGRHEPAGERSPAYGRDVRRARVRRGQQSQPLTSLLSVRDVFSCLAGRRGAAIDSSHESR